ncbi:hypothetical protein SAMN05192559_106134 [Halobacillus karajensis]|uniref:Uncharacterized protein n=1 Tax=Halobacillus karajensis TaxID=195088 RepID=A0A024P7P2_9BACI|nr:hypothetical protein BN982_03446 [Halobacillus karajensis]CDQ24853.1 hypothetical protein BN983_03152 [Halobacillus karajensis]CDQ28787.1 hypothetical protein BN981_03102 [Halobacillus karajensis]SEH96403.1 hypothetical protein SAMN05192559_106134 [Halobacillus karajensis]
MKNKPVHQPELDFFTLLNPDFGRWEEKEERKGPAEEQV